MSSKTSFWKRSSLNKLCLFLFIPSLLLLSGCEADQTVSTFERKLMNAQQHLFEENKLTVLTQSDYQAIWEDKIDSKEEAALLNATPAGVVENTKGTRTKLEQHLFAFIKHILNYRYTAITTDYFSSLDLFVTNPLSESLKSSKYYENLYQDIYTMHALSDIQMVEFYDQYTPQYTTIDNKRIYRSKAIVITQNSADDTFFYKYPNMTRGANLHSIYLYYTDQEDELDIFAYCIQSMNTNSIFFAAPGVLIDNSYELKGDYPPEIVKEAAIRLRNVTIDREKSKAILNNVNQFLNYALNSSHHQEVDSLNFLHKSPDDSMLTFLHDYNLSNKISVPLDYHSSFFDMAMLTANLYADSNAEYYIFYESIPIEVQLSNDNVSGFNLKEGLWMYALFFKIDVNDPKSRIVDYLLVPTKQLK